MSYRMLILYAIYLLPLVGGGVPLWGWLQLRAFVRSHASISSRLELDDLKRVVKTDMFLAIVVVLIFGLIPVLGAFGLYCDLVGWSDLTALFILGPLCCLAGVKLMAVEKQVRNTPLENETLREEFDHVLRRWTSSTLPDW